MALYPVFASVVPQWTQSALQEGLCVRDLGQIFYTDGEARQARYY